MTAIKYINAWLILSIFALLIGLYVNYVFVMEDGEVPSEVELTTINGQLKDFKIKNNGIRFEIIGFEPALLFKTKSNNPEVVSVFENSESTSIYTVLIDGSEEECQQKLDYSCFIWSLQIDDTSFLDYGISAKQAQESTNRIDVLSKVLIIIGVIGTIALVFFRAKSNKTR
jgi:hypothetical protein